MKEHNRMDLDSKLVNELKRIYELLRNQMRQKWNRDLPLEELLFDRWERARQLGFGDGTSIYHNSYVYGDVKVGKNTWIGPFTLLDGTGGLEIGDFCSISTGVQIYTHDTVDWAVSGGVKKPKRAPVHIADFCYIGPQTVIAKGITISSHSIIGACSFINRDIPANSIVAGVPGQVIGKVTISDGKIKYEYMPVKPISKRGKAL